MRARSARLVVAACTLLACSGAEQRRELTPPGPPAARGSPAGPPTASTGTLAREDVEAFDVHY